MAVSNHSSYLDHLVLAAILPGELSFAAKKDLAPQLFEGTFLKRLDTLFVERFEARGRLADTAEAAEESEEGAPRLLSGCNDHENAGSSRLSVGSISGRREARDTDYSRIYHRDTLDPQA